MPAIMPAEWIQKSKREIQEMTGGESGFVLAALIRVAQDQTAWILSNAELIGTEEKDLLDQSKTFVAIRKEAEGLHLDLRALDPEFRFRMLALTKPLGFLPIESISRSE